MNDTFEIEKTVQSAKNGDPAALEHLYSLLHVRFLPVAARRLQMSRTIADPGRIDELASGFCRSAVLKANEICPVTSERWSLIRLMAIFNNLADDYILTLLTENAQKGDAGAENRLFEILRKKLMERLSYKR